MAVAEINMNLDWILKNIVKIYLFSLPQNTYSNGVKNI